MTDSITRKEEPVVPPGIVAFVRNGNVLPYYPKAWEGDYNKWATIWLSDPAYLIHSILVDGVQWEVDEWVIFRGRQEQITTFEFSDGLQWKVKLKAFDDDLRFAIQALSKLPPTPAHNPVPMTTQMWDDIMTTAAGTDPLPEQGTGKEDKGVWTDAKVLEFLEYRRKQHYFTEDGIYMTEEQILEQYKKQKQ